jgi:transcriptional regulator with XRE-family HTH domain
MRKEWFTPRFLRERAGLTQQEVADVLDKRIATISDWERHVSVPNLSLTETLKLIRLYECTLEEAVEAFDRVDPKEI